ncbi:MAG: serine/threonine-protein kinase [Deltaproteobacteria bacterium]|nr:serine/threonine-protein kinase [Deltaproteobacteria bacterium]
MSSDSWRTLEEVFERAVELEGEEREAFLQQRCSDDEKLLQVLQSLLASDESAGAYLEGPLAEAEVEAKPAASPLAKGHWVGPFQILEKLGEGGMSTVYRATRQDDTFHRQVALKVIRRGMESAETLRRLRIERQILARLEHPHIARLYEGGMTEEGLPYFVMELVDGVPIDHFCQQHQLSIDDRLELVKKICGAVQYAHQNLIVHRDLKPNNILVTADGEPKLLDFGIAKLLDPTTVSKTEATSAWVRLLTPHYAAPEQLEGKPVSTATDVYSLGVLLYKLLTGELPFLRKSHQSLKDLEALVLSSKPPKPSLVAQRQRARQSSGSHSREGAQETASSIASDERLQRRLSGDLDTIVLKAMNRDPQRRYPSAEGLATDLHQHLSGFPVLARRDSWSYRTGKFLRRHRLAVGTAAAFVSVLVAGGFALAFQATSLRLERDQLQEVVSLVVDIFEVAGEGEPITVRQAVDRSTALLDVRLGQQPEVQATLLHTIGRIYLNLGATGQAQTLLEEAVGLRSHRFGSDSLEAAESLSFLGLALALNGEFEDGEARSREALDLYRQHLGTQSPDLVPPMNTLVGVLCARNGASDEAQKLAAETLEMAQRLLDKQSFQLGLALSHRALLLSREGEHDDAAALYRQALDLYRHNLGEEHPEIAVLTNNLAFANQRRGELEEAEDLFREALSLNRKLLGTESSTLAQSAYNLGNLNLELGRFDEAEPLFREALGIVTAVHGPDHYSTLLITVGLASTHISQGLPQDAELLLRQGLELWSGPLEGTWFLATAVGVLGESILSQGRHEEAEPLLRKSHSQILELRGDQDPKTREAAARLETLRQKSGRDPSPGEVLDSL